MSTLVPQPSLHSRPRWPRLLALTGLVMLLHGWLIGGLALGEAGVDPALPAPTVQVRTVMNEAPVPPAPIAATAVPTPAPKPVRRVQTAAAVAPVAPAPAALAEPVETSASAIDAALVVAVAASNPPPTLNLDVSDLPVYRTQMPPPATLRYDLRRGFISGSGELIWRLAGKHYELRLEGRAAGLNLLTQTSQGELDDAGIAPQRYTDQRLRGGVQAANFQRDRGKITYSGPRTEFPLPVGAQDRLSWMIQLGAVVSAEPQRAIPGGKVMFFVSGARGDADVWTFRYVAAESVETNAGPVSAVKFTRDPRKAYDTLVEVWLDPARHHVPVRAKLSAPPNGDALELVLREVSPP